MQTVADLVFHNELEVLAKRHTNFFYIPVLTEASDQWQGATGYVTPALIKEKLSVDEKAHYYFCGPPVMTDGIVESLEASGVTDEYIHTEKFASPAAFDPDKIPQRKAQVGVGSENYSYDGKESLLEFLEDKNVDITFACRSGVCGACKCKLVSGEVDSFTDAGLSNAEKKNGYLLTCVTRPVSDVKLQLIDE
jgi:Na+-transporting NADH:ubiquinone oxidoreductase subunit NqrF